MAKFTLSAVTTSGEVLLTYFDATNNQFGGLTFDESLNNSCDTSELIFSAMKYRIENGQQLINLPITSLTYGTIIRLRERDIVTEFKIQSINYTFLPNNLQLQFTCLDRFQAEATKIGVGYTIQADPTDPNFLGAQSIDTWARKIIRETNLPWGYINVDEANATLIKQLASEEQIFARDNITDSAEWDRINDALINEFAVNPATLNAAVSFECSNANAFEALKKLASDNELILRVDYSTNNIYFIPQKNWWFKGYYFNPHINLQQMGLQGDGQNMATVLNVTGAKDINDQEITLVPSIPEDFEKFVSTADWENSYYYPTFFDDHSTDKNFATLASLIPWFENKLIDISFYRNKLITPQQEEDINNILTNDLRRVNAPLIIATRNHLKNVEKWMMDLQKIRTEVENKVGYVVGALDTMLDTLVTPNNNSIAPSAVFLVSLYDTLFICIPCATGLNLYINNSTASQPTIDRMVIPIQPTFSLTENNTLRFQSGTQEDTLIINFKYNTNIYDLSYTVPTINGPIPELDSFLNEEAAALNAAAQTLAKNSYLLRTYWEGNNYRHESFYCQFKPMGMYTKNDTENIDPEIDEQLTARSFWSTADQSAIGTAALDALIAYFGKAPTRSQVIQECANIAAKMNEYWTAMRRAALQQGVFVPTSWDCVDFYKAHQSVNIFSPWLISLLPLTDEIDSNNQHHYRISDYYGRDSVPQSIKPQSIYRYKFYDQQRDIVNPLVTNNVQYLAINTDKVITSNTDNYYEKQTDITEDDGYIWYTLSKNQRTLKDTIQLFRTKLKYQDMVYNIGHFMPATLQSTPTWPSDGETYIEKYYHQLLQCYVQGTTMYQWQAKHDEIWQHLYAAYPGIFNETTYNNTDAASSMDLYFAAKAQLTALNQPEFSYSLTGIDIYSRDDKLLLWNVKLGDQVRIDYVEDEANPQIVDMALRESLYVTGINHSLRDDGNYQFNVATRKATDTMVRRFARLLTLGR